MNRAEATVLEKVPEDSTVYELIRTGFAERKTRLVDMLFDEVLTLNRTVSQLKGKEAYFLVINGTQAELVTVSGDTISERKEAPPEAVAGKKTFANDGYTYKRYRKIL
ncbi:hypothetical protein AV656_00980 [Bhargavaea cecembensis]|uniref:Uncharacterized protein n=1 Tax=Bhargavaea cecembensis TaxID=394098 RepID=A0A165HGQ8_9BACL|nr:hypothetical protein [Bhargavaea cecembensis]KZE39889.1 hypothetical protein AV656_00980 [Bhargavaea cecembensis]